MARDAIIYKKVCQENGHDYIMRDAPTSSFMCRQCGGTPDEQTDEQTDDDLEAVEGKPIVMDKSVLLDLPEYSTSYPTGIFYGKRWRALVPIADPECPAPHDIGMPLFLHSDCHPDMPTWASYKDGAVTIVCAECGTFIISILVAGND